jgi:hypothetical protein
VLPAAMWGERKPAYWVVEGRGNGGAVAVNRLVQAGASPSWTTSGLDVTGFHHEPGAIVVPYNRAHEAIVAGIAKDLGLRVDGAKGKLPSNLLLIGRARVGLLKPWTASIDEGWTRLVLEQYGFAFTSLTDQQVRAGNLRAGFDVILLPNVPGERLAAGASDDVLPAEYAGGLGGAGLQALRAFVESGGSLVCLGQSADLAVRTFDLPVRDAARDNDQLFVPGSIVRLSLDTTQPLAYGMPSESAGVFAFSSVYQSVAPSAGSAARGLLPTSLRTVARYGEHDVLLSGWLEGETLMAGREAVLEARVGAGRVVLFGFPVQHRGQSLATFRLLFNALFTSPQALPRKKGK